MHGARKAMFSILAVLITLFQRFINFEMLRKNLFIAIKAWLFNIIEIRMHQIMLEMLLCN